MFEWEEVVGGEVGGGADVETEVLDRAEAERALQNRTRNEGGERCHWLAFTQVDGEEGAHLARLV